MAEGLLLSPTFAARIGRVVRRVESWPQDLTSDPRRRPVEGDWFLARIGQHEQLPGAARWKYAWMQVVLTENDTLEPPPGAMSSTVLGLRYALNMVEANNIAQHTGVQGNSVNQMGADYPAGFNLRPVGGEGLGGFPANPVIVQMFRTADETGQTRFVFWYENADDGICDPPVPPPVP